LLPQPLLPPPALPLLPPLLPPLVPQRPASPVAIPDPPAAQAALHPAVWHAHQLARPGAAVRTSGFAALDRQLPGGGWPCGALTELLLPHPGVGELRLLAPALVALQAAGGQLMWFDPPATPCAWTLEALGLDLRRLVLVQGKGRHSPLTRARLPAADTLWALEQALKSGHVDAVLAWLPARLPLDVLRRLQLAAQAHAGPAWLLRGWPQGEAGRPIQPPARHPGAHAGTSPAPLRLALASAGPDRLRIHIIKRRGPPALQPLTLDLAPALAPSVAARAAQGPASLPARSRGLVTAAAAAAAGAGADKA